MSIKLGTPSNYLILCFPLLLLPSTFPSIRVFSNELVLHIRWQKNWSFSFSISPSNEYSGLISLGWTTWISLLSKGLSKSLLQHHNSKVSILQHSVYFIVQLSHPYMTTGKTTALTKRTFVSKVMSLLFNMLSRLVRALLPRSKRLSFMAAFTICNDFGAQKIKSLTVSISSPSICHELMGPDAMILVFWMLNFKPTFSPSSRGSLVLLSFLP